MQRLVIAALCALSGCVLLEWPGGATLDKGTWGGKDAGLIVTDTGAHLHVGCTLGDAPGPIALDADGRFDVAGRYNLTAHPVDAGIYHPARLSGRVDPLLKALTLSVTVTDTLRDTTIVLGPVRLRLGTRPDTGPCPICVTPGDRMRATR